MWQPAVLWFLTLWHHAFRQNTPIACEVRMVGAVAPGFGFSHPQPWADFLAVPPQPFSPALPAWRVSPGHQRPRRLMVQHAAETRKPGRSTRAATRSSAGTTLAIANRVMDRGGTLRRGPWSWERGRSQTGMRGHDVLGMGCTLQQSAVPGPGLFCPHQGRSPPTQAALRRGRLTQRHPAVRRAGMASTPRPLTMDSAAVSQARRTRRHQRGGLDRMMAGPGNDVLPMDAPPWEASTGKHVLRWAAPTWGLDVPAGRLWGDRPTVGSLRRGVFRPSTTRSASLLPWRQRALRGAARWHLGHHHHGMACCWQRRPSMCPLRFLHLPGDGLYPAVPSHVCAALVARRVQAPRVFSTLPRTEIMRQLRREEGRDGLMTHFHAPFSIG